MTAFRKKFSFDAASCGELDPAEIERFAFIPHDSVPQSNDPR
jgi:hypothetical protein